MASSVDEEALHQLYLWVDSIPLSRPKRNLSRDFSDGGVRPCVCLHVLSCVDVHKECVCARCLPLFIGVRSGDGKIWPLRLCGSVYLYVCFLLDSLCNQCVHMYVYLCACGVCVHVCVYLSQTRSGDFNDSDVHLCMYLCISMYTRCCVLYVCLVGI